MRRILTAGIGMVVVTGLLYAAAGSTDPQGDPALAEQQMDQISYGVGFYLGEEIRAGLELDDVKADADLLLMGFADGLKSNAPIFDREELEDILEAVHREMQARMVKRLLAEDPAFKKLHDENLAKSRAFHEAHGKKGGVVTLSNGLQYKVLEPGTGRSPELTDVVAVKVRASLIDGTEVVPRAGDETQVEDCVEGGIQILQMMKVGAKWEFAIPPELAFGSGGRFPDIGPNETIVGEVELLEIK